METIARSERRAPYILILIFMSLAGGILTTGYLYYQHHKKHYRFEAERGLSAIAKLKADELVDWRNERLGDAGIFYKNAVFSALVRRFFEKPDDTETQGQLRTWLSQVQASYKYDRVMLLDASYSKKMIVPDGPERISSFISQHGSEILRAGKVFFKDFYWNEQNQRIYLKVLVPILDEANDNRLIGILALRIDPEKYLYPFINHWPTPSRTAETLLVRREGAEVLFLNELRFQKNTALKLRFPLDEKKELLAVKAALGQKGIVQGLDYRGVPVIADVRAVPDSPWFLVTRIDTSELYAPLKEKLWLTIVLVGILLIGTSAGVGFIWKQQSSRFYRQQYEAAEALRESEKQYKALFKANTDGILIADVRTKKFRYANPAICRMLGYSEEEFTRMGVADIHPKESLEQVIAEFEAQTSGAKITAEDLPCVRKDGQVISVSINSGTVMIDQTEHLMGVFRDITERKQIEETQRHLVAIIEATPDFVGFADVNDKHIIYVNKAGRKMCGIGNDEDVTKLKIYDVHPEWTNKMFAEEILPAAVRDGIWTGECAFLDIRDRHEIPVLMVLSSHKASNGEVEAFSTISRDITERKRAEEMLKQAKAEAEAANEAKSEFLANMSHEIRTPMNVIIGFCDILTQEDIPAEQREYLETIRSAGENLLSIINDILDFTKIEAGKLEVELIECSLDQMLSYIDSMMRPAAIEKGLGFETIQVGPVPNMIRTDPLRLRQCLINLISNAVKFTEKGHVHVKVSSENINQKCFIKIAVEDTGIGIGEDKHKIIFESFTQADGSTTRKYGGTGLGLTITHKLAHLLGGEIAVTSEPDKGSVFTLLVPAGLSPDEAAAQPDLGLQDKKRAVKHAVENTSTAKFAGKLLVAEDNPSNQMLVEIILKKMGFNIVMVDNGAQAVEKATSQSFDIILMDMQMPVMNGYQATEILRQKGIGTPIIAFTAHALKGDAEKCLAAGCDDYLPKPVTKENLQKMLRKYLRSTSPDFRLSRKLAAKNQDAPSDTSPLVSELADDPDLAEVLKVFRDDLPRQLDKITEALADADLPQLKYLIHTLKGSGGSAGFPIIMEKARKAEQLIIKGEIDALKSNLDEL